MDMTPKEYQDYVAQKAKKSPIVKDTLLAFFIGGAILTAIMTPLTYIGVKNLVLQRRARHSNTGTEK